MPSRNIIRFDVSDGYYHVYARGISRSNIFIDDTDKDYFLFLFSRMLSIKPVVSRTGYPYPHNRGRVELLSYCLMDNHFHLLFYQHEKGVLSEFMRSLIVSYTAYFNRKYVKSGPLFESRYKASLVNKDSYLAHISRYIHLNPRSWKRYKYSSFWDIRKGTEPEWLQSSKVIELFAGRKDYIDFVADYEENKKMLAEIKYELANL